MCRYTVDDSIVAKFVWLGQLAVDHRDVGHSSVAISKGCINAPSFAISFRKTAWAQSESHDAIVVRRVRLMEQHRTFPPIQPVPPK
jgi:hypothetical protein